MALRDPAILAHTFSPAERRVLGDCVAALRAHFGTRLARVVLFGSRARGDVHEDSDVDLLLLVLEGPVALEDRDAAHRIAGRYELATGEPLLLAPKLMAIAQLEHLRARERRFARNLEREGIEL